MYKLPDLTNKTLVEALLEVDNQIQLNPVSKETNQYLPGVIMGYGANLKVDDEVEKESFVDVYISKKPTNAYTNDNKVNFVSEIGLLTSFDSINGDVLRDAGICGTDLGIPVDLGDEVILLFGDSFSSNNMQGLWQSNFIARSKDFDLHDGLQFDSIVTSQSGMALPFAQGLHQEGRQENTGSEVTKIPTGGIKIGEYVYVFYMSIRYWGVAGSWLVNYNQCIKSKDLIHWENVDSLCFREEEAFVFGQIYPFKDPKTDYIYLYGIPGGRNHGCVLARTTIENFEDRSKYEYLISDGQYVMGDEGLRQLNSNPYYVITPAVSELSVIYNEYLEKYCVVFYRNGKIIMQMASSPDSLFNDSITLLTNTNYNGLYGGFMLPKYTADGGKSFYITVSSWAIYNVYLVKVVLN